MEPQIKQILSVHINAAITQLVECLAVNQDVTGSSPVGGVQRPDKP